MVDVEQLSAWIAVVVIFIALPFLLVGPNRPRHAVAVRLQRVGSRVLPRLQSVRLDPDDPDFDPVESAALRDSARRERLYADLARLRQLIATDTAMSATRQLGNRLAYDQLRAAVAELPRPEPRQPYATVAFGRSAPPAPSAVCHAPVREVIDLDWRRHEG